MTTIAYDGKTLAADTCCVTNDTYCGPVKKIHTLKDGRIIAASGNLESAKLLIDYLDGVIESPDFKDFYLEALIVSRDGECKYMSHRLIEIEQSVPAAIGSGCDFALAAMDCGAGAERAVEVACGRDINSSLPVSVAVIKS